MRWWLCSGGLLWAQVAVLPCAPTLIAVDEIGHVYAWCSAEKSLLKVWAPQYDSITRVGGGPGAREGFLDIRSLAPVGNQQLYVLDVGQQALLLLGTNLQVLQKVRFEEMAPELWQGFPSELTVMPGGDFGGFAGDAGSDSDRCFWADARAVWGESYGSCGSGAYSGPPSG
jgi:hypothetical protein